MSPFDLLSPLLPLTLAALTTQAAMFLWFLVLCCSPLNLLFLGPNLPTVHRDTASNPSAPGISDSASGPILFKGI